MIASSRTPPALIDRLHDEALKALASPEVRERLTQLGAEPLPMSPEAFSAYIKSEMQAAARIAKAAKLQAQ
jgi:tripartite-type tricarboxylate transporter receptor subunit TctC